MSANPYQPPKEATDQPESKRLLSTAAILLLATFGAVLVFVLFRATYVPSAYINLAPPTAPGGSSPAETEEEAEPTSVPEESLRQ